MPIDIARVLGVVTREITSRDHDGKQARVLVASRTYPTERDDLWDALTNAERIPRWFLPISGDLRLGGHFQFEGNAGGEITGCEPPSRLTVTWGMHGQVSWVEVALAEVQGGTELRLEHIAHVPDDLWAQFGPGGVGIGWESALLGLDQYFSTGASVTPETGMAWLGSPEGHAFIRGSSQAWADASVADGTPREAAEAAAGRVAAMYMGM